MNEKSALKHGQAKIQYYACREKVYQLQDAGYSIQAIYDLLTADGVISMSYKALHRNISKDRGPVEKKQQLPKRLPSVNALPAPSENSGLPIPAKLDQPSERSASDHQVAEWSLDEKLAVINAGSTSKKARKRGFDEETEEYNETEVL